ncbi:hypothetical protein [Xanthomonas sacchari]|uniref:Uncharacterized protein n=1 Tax=Xanthomonas sacchari TaxID=56458 RepID=A0AA46SUV6_9XANT|nr:hypothetical protein [Xanthomonas sacchari]UYK88942.1 hypothetical protein NG824_00275 [Xanthomonas sacchari]
MSTSHLSTRHLDALKEQLRELKEAQPPHPWREVATIAVAGLHSIGFDMESEYLLVVSSAGRGVIDCHAGQKVARDYEENYEGEEFLEANGIGPLQGKKIRTSGLPGGGLPLGTSDGWHIELVTLDWPIREIILVEPFSSLYGARYGKPAIFHKIYATYELRAIGFSYTGKTLVIATSSDIVIFSRGGS